MLTFFQYLLLLVYGRPSPKNMRAFEKWSKAEDHSGFFGDHCDDCRMMTLSAGHTFMIPTGWIHAVYVLYNFRKWGILF